MDTIFGVRFVLGIFLALWLDTSSDADFLRT